MTKAEYMRKWRAENREKVLAYSRNRYAADRAKSLATTVVWQKAHPIEYAIHRKVASANKHYPGRLRVQDVRDVIARCGWVCCWCQKTITKLRDFTLEHLKPVNDPAHLAIACQSCNSARVPSFGFGRRLTPEELYARDRASSLKSAKACRAKHRAQENAAARARYHANIEERRAYFREWSRKKRERDRAAGV